MKGIKRKLEANLFKPQKNTKIDQKENRLSFLEILCLRCRTYSKGLNEWKMSDHFGI